MQNHLMDGEPTKNMLSTENSKMIMDYKTEEVTKKRLSPESYKIPNNKEQVQLR